MNEERKDIQPSGKPIDKSEKKPPRTGGFSGLHARMRSAQAEKRDRAEMAHEMPNRIALVADCSGSMSSQAVGGAGKPIGKRINLERQALTSYVESVDFSNTSVGLRGVGDDRPNTQLVVDDVILRGGIGQVEAAGGTPIFSTLGEVIKHMPITRAVLISDGEATDGSLTRDDEKDYGGYNRCADAIIDQYVEAKIPIDCVHIGDQSGEVTLKEIAKRTGGLYVKFEDLDNFVKSFKYLTPAYRALLEAPGTDKAKLLGAKEVE